MSKTKIWKQLAFLLIPALLIVFAVSPASNPIKSEAQSILSGILGKKKVAQNPNMVPAWERFKVKVDGITELDMSGAEIYQVPGKLPYIVMDGHTWIPVAGEPIEVSVLHDGACSQNCQAGIGALRANITPAIIQKDVDINSAEGKALASKFDIESIPQFIFGNGLATFKSQDGSLFIDNLPEGLVTEKDGLYWLQNSGVGLKADKFIKPPQFADLDSEPTKGTGPVQVVEFTDYQCPFCKRLFDNNRELVERLVAENKITYVLKDFPLNFHQDAVNYTHAVASCTKKVGDNDAYWKMHAAIFDNMDTWSGKGDAGKQFLVDYAKNDLGLDIEACLADPSTNAEVQADVAEGAKYGVSGTPALFIGTQIMPGAIDAATFEKAVNEEAGK